MKKIKIYNYVKAREAGYSFKEFLASFLKDRLGKEELEELNPLNIRFSIFSQFKELILEVQKKTSNGSTIAIIGDYDVDGITASSILYKGLKKLFPNTKIEVILPDRKEDGYGIKEKLVDKAIELKASVIFTVDNGINAIKAIKYAESKGILVVLTDHHIPNDDEYKDIKYVINPHTSESNLKECEVCGAYIALITVLNLFKAAEYIPTDKFIKELYEIASIGTIADVMPIRYENRALLSCCMPRFANGVALNKGLQLLISALDKCKILEQDNIAFYLTPCLNAGGRLESANHGFTLFTSDDLPTLAKEATYLVSLNERRKEISSTLEEYLKNQIDESSKVQIIQVPNQFNNFSDREIGGVIGIVAQKVVEKSNCPSLIFYGNRFSGRSLPDVNLNDLLASSKTPTFTFGGHAQACGGGIEFVKYGETLKKELSTNVLNFEKTVLDSYIRIPDDMSPQEILNSFEALKPCDLKAFPRLMMENVTIEKILTFANVHTQISFKMNGKIETAMKFYDKLDVKAGDVIKKLIFKVSPLSSNYKSENSTAIIIEELCM